MGTIHHHVAVATVGYNHTRAQEAFDAVVEFAKSLNDPLTDNYESLLIGPVDGVMNSYTSYLLVPDGSKEWWPTSEDCNDIRTFFIQEMTEAGADVFVGSWGELNTTGEAIGRDD